MYGRLADGKQLVYDGHGDGEANTDCPCSDSPTRGTRVVMVVDDSAYLGIGAVVCDHGDFQLHFLDEIPVVVRICKDVGVLCVGTRELVSTWLWKLQTCGSGRA